MPKFNEDNTDPTQETPDPYLDRLPPADLATYQNSSPALDLVREIRLLRTTLSALLDNIPDNHRAITQVARALVRSLYIQAKQLRGPDDLIRTLHQRAEDILDESAGERRAGNNPSELSDNLGGIHAID